MIEGLGPEATDLLREAHRDVPSHAQRAQMWQGIEAGVVGSAVAVGGVKAMSGLTKILLGVFIGGALTATIGAVVIPALRHDTDSGSQPVIARKSVDAPSVIGSNTNRSVGSGTDFEFGTDPLTAGGSARADGKGNNGLSPTSANADNAHGDRDNANSLAKNGTAAATNKTTTVNEDPLVRKARLLSEARGALLRGDADQALRIARTARSMPNSGLEPEELALEARALRQLGRPSEAEAVERDLAQRFPENSLTR